MDVTELQNLARQMFDTTGENAPVALCFSYTMTIVALGNVPPENHRQVIQAAVKVVRADLVAVVTECWRTQSKKPEEVSLCATLWRAGRLEEAPDHLRSEVLQLIVEGIDRPFRMWGAEITRAEDGTRTLGEWEEVAVNRPSQPGWRRYFPVQPVPRPVVEA